MSATIRIKKRAADGSAGAPSSLAPSELAFNENASDKKLYYGYGDDGSGEATSVIAIGGPGAFCDLTSAQTVAGNKTFSNNVVVSGNLTVNGTTTSISSSTVDVEDKNLELGKVSSPSDTTADGGGITLKGATDKTFNWVDSTDSWTSSEHIDLASGKVLKVNGTQVLSATNFTGTSATTTALASGRTVGMTGDVVWTSASFDGTGNVTGTSTIQTGAVETGMIAADAVTAAKIGDDVIDSEHIAAGAVDLEHMSANSVDSTQYVDGSIDTAHLAADCVTAAKIADDVINSEHYAAGSIDLEHMSSNSVDEDNLYISNAGSNGQFLSKQSGNNGGLTWATPSTGTATTMTVADESSDATCFPLFVTAATGDLSPKSGSNLTFNSSTGVFAATQLDGLVDGGSF